MANIHNSTTILIASADYHTVKKTITLTAAPDATTAPAVIAGAIGELWMRFISSLFKQSIKKANAKFLENVVMEYEVATSADASASASASALDVYNMYPSDVKAYLEAMSAQFYIKDIVYAKSKAKRTYTAALKGLGACKSLNDVVNSKLASVSMFQPLAAKLGYALRYPVYAHKLDKLRHVKTGMLGECILDNRARNALAKYFTGYRPQQRNDLADAEKVIEYAEFLAVPYVVRRKADAVPFVSLDAVALHLEIPYDIRLRYNILNAIELAMDEGHMYTSLQQIHKLNKMAHAGDIRATPVEAISSVVQTCEDFRYVSDEEIYTKVVYDMQDEFVDAFRTLIRREKEPVCDKVTGAMDVDEYIAKFEFDHGQLKLHEKQKDAIYAFAAGEPLIILTGGPGTGKSFVIEAITGLAAQAAPAQHTALCAPTGKAAKRLGKNGLTIHRLVYSKNMFTDTGYLQFDVIIIDESSMIDFGLAHMLISKVDMTRTRLIFVGDPKQLPPISYGKPFMDLINTMSMSSISSTNSSVTAAAVQLVKVFRQDGNSPISTLARAIDAGEEPTDAMLNNDSIKFFTTRTKEEKYACLNKACNVVKKMYEKNDGYDRVQVLCCTNETGTFSNRSINDIIHGVIYPGHVLNDFRDPERGEKVLVTKNNYVLHATSKQVDPLKSSFNGDIGLYERMGNDFARTIKVQNGGGIEGMIEVDVPKENLELGHSITIHKSQGSEYDTVCLFLDHIPNMLVRELFYTAITRAKKMLYIFGTRELIRTCIQNKTPPRNSKISDYIK